jgi:glutaminase
MHPTKRNAVAIAAGAALLLISGAALAKGPMPTSSTDIQAALDQAYAKAMAVTGGKNADYIPVLAKVDPNIFGLALVTTDGHVFTKGDIKSEVSIQSISKVFTMGLVLEQHGSKPIEDNIGVDATGQPFNSIVAVEQHKGLQQNPFVNPGAITTTSMVNGANRQAIWNNIIRFYSDAAGRPLKINAEVYKSESDTNQRNQAIAALMYAYGRIKANPQQATSIYTEQCSVSVNAKDLAMMAAMLANGGRNPVTGKQIMKPENVAEVLAVMATAGLYDDAGVWLFRTGLPAKSGVGGGIIAVAPGRFGVAAISPPLDTAGNSVKAQAAIEAVDTALNANPYSVTPNQGYGGQK